MQKSNSLTYTTGWKVYNGGERIRFTIRLDDECKNGHQDFSVTGDIEEKYQGNWRELGGGAIGDQIKRFFPKLDIFNTLHLCDYEGNPMYPEANGHFHMFNDKMPKDKYCEYYRITYEQYEQLQREGKEKEYFAYLIQVGIPSIRLRWKEQANTAIKLLEKLTKKTFAVDSVRTNLRPLTVDQIKEIESKKASGYYEPAKIQERIDKAEEDRKKKKIEDLKNSFERKVKEMREDLAIDITTVSEGWPDNIIYYKHNNTIVFNWQNSTYRGAFTHSLFMVICERYENGEFEGWPVGAKLSIDLKNTPDEKV